MGSRIMHLIIAENIGEDLGLNKKRFSYGNLIPDAHMKEPETKARSHFKIPESKFGDERYLGYELFLQKYHKQIKDEAYLGYYSHLISDELWLKEVYAKYMLDENNEPKKELANQYYRDFGILNGILIKKYRLELEEIDYKKHLNIEEIDNSLIEEVLKGLNSDFTEPNKSSELGFFEEEDIINYITNTIEIVSEKIKVLL